MATRPVSALSIDPSQVIGQAVAQYQKQTLTPGLCIAVYDPNYFGTSGFVQPYGVASLATNEPVLADTIFEIGSVTKVFTSLLLASAIETPDSQVKLTDPVINYLSTPFGVTGSPLFQQIQLLNLATHTSGMPDMASVLKRIGNQLFNDEPPSSQLVHYWNNYTGPAVPNCWLYSNEAFVTLGFAVSAMFSGVQGNGYNKLLLDYVTQPLGMPNTNSTPTAPSIATGYNYNGSKQTPGASAASDLKSTGTDLLVFLKAYLGATQIPTLLGNAMALTMAAQGTYPICGSNRTMSMGLAWQIPSVGGHPLYFKNGATGQGGFSCAVEFLPSANFGIAVLTNEFWPKAPKGGNTPGALAGIIRNQLEPGLSAATEELEDAEEAHPEQ